MNSTPSLTSDITQPYKDSEVVIIGAGPIGLWTAIQTKILSGRQITVIEKYQEYKRADIRLNIAADSFAGVPENSELKNLVDRWKGKLVPIKEMEDALIILANSLGISILKGYQAEAKDLPTQFPSTEIFIDAGGTRSKTRAEIFGDQFRFNTTLQYVVQVQYIIKKPLEENEEPTSIERKIRKIYDLSETYKMQKFAEHLISETVRPNEDGSSRVTLQIFVDKSVYDKISDATFGTPYYFETDLNKVPDTLREILIKWWGAKEELNNHLISPEADKLNKLTVIALGSYCSKDIVKVTNNGNLFALVGDAAEAFPYFRAINNGFLLGTKLAKCVQEAFKNFETKKSPKFASYFRSYSRYAIKRAYIERIRAFVKNIFVTISSYWIWVSNLVPWQSVKLTKDQKENMYQRGAKVWESLTGLPPPPRVKKSLFETKIKS